MAKYVTVRVTQWDIDNGLRGSSNDCPIAIALGRAGYPDAVVFGAFWRPTHPALSVPMSRPAAKFADRFDDGESVNPSTFHLPLVPILL